MYAVDRVTQLETESTELKLDVVRLLLNRMTDAEQVALLELVFEACPSYISGKLFEVIDHWATSRENTSELVAYLEERH